ncbi:MAG: trypsin-like peptidase domain-containing protein [Fuerstiella sp.]
MSIGVHCESCTSEFHVTAEFSGKLIRCPSCQEPVRVPGQTSDSSQPVILAAEPVRQEPARPRRQRSRPAAKRPAARNPSFETQGRAPTEALNRRSARVDVARRNRRKKSQQNFPVGLAVGLGVGIAGLLIAVGAFFLRDSDDHLVADSSSSQTPAPSTHNEIDDNAAYADTSSQPVTEPSTASAPSNTENSSPVTVAGSQTSPPSTTNYGSATDSAGLPSTDDDIADSGSNTSATNSPPTMASSSDSSTDTTSDRPPVLPSWSAVNTLVGPSVVRVDAKLSGGGGQGSGFVLDAEQGVAVTNYHVIEGALDASISFENGDRIRVDGFLFLDSVRDIALLKFDPSQSTQAKLRSLPIAIAHPLKGAEVAAFGAPIGLDFSMTQNIISAIRPAQQMKEMVGVPNAKGTWLQHGVAISPGNSGGPLVNKRGEVVGINTMHLAIGQNLNFAISGLDISDGYQSQLPKMLAVSPVNAPEMNQWGGSGPEGSFEDPYERPEIEIVDVTGEDQAQELLAKMKSLTILSIAFTDDPNGTVTGAVRTEARKTIDRCKIKLSSSSSADYVMIMVMNLERSGNKNTLRMTSQILTKNDRARQVLKIWELTEDVGTISMQSIYRAYLPPNLKRDIQKYFAKVRLELVNARRDYKPKTDDDEKSDKK